MRVERLFAWVLCGSSASGSDKKRHTIIVGAEPAGRLLAAELGAVRATVALIEISAERRIQLG
jgi:NADPH-dependent 2,4-dienoyl-CoA reductase/sulfur reductase-like enzyme